MRLDMNKMKKKLQIDKEFKALIQPLPATEYEQLEKNIISDGCRNPIITWNGVIIDGHNRYDICHRNNIAFETLEKSFECREDVIAWICANQLGRRNIAEETRKFLIGVQYENEKIVAKHRNPKGKNQYTTEREGRRQCSGKEHNHTTAIRIASENNISEGTVQKYASYARAIASIQNMAPDIAKNILAGRYKLSHESVIELSKLTPREFRETSRMIEAAQQTSRGYIVKPTRTYAVMSQPSPEKHSIKDLPAFDPDAELTGITLTVPSWVSSMERICNVVDFSIVSDSAKKKMIEALDLLQEKTIYMKRVLREAHND